MRDIKQYSKIDHKTLHFLPFVPSIGRKKNFSIRRKWGNWEVFLTASETLNAFDLINLLYIVKQYLVGNSYYAGNIGDREVLGIEIDVSSLLKERGILNKKANRQTFLNSLLRLKSVNITFSSQKFNKQIHTGYFYEIENDLEIKNITIFANKSFIEFVINNGILINLKRLNNYKEQYAILLDLYLQGNKIKKNDKYYYRDKFSFSEIERALKLDLTNMDFNTKLKKIKKAFLLLNKNGLPNYSYSKLEKMFIKSY